MVAIFSLRVFCELTRCSPRAECWLAPDRIRTKWSQKPLILHNPLRPPVASCQVRGCAWAPWFASVNLLQESLPSHACFPIGHFGIRHPYLGIGSVLSVLKTLNQIEHFGTPQLRGAIILVLSAGSYESFAEKLRDV